MKPQNTGDVQALPLGSQVVTALQGRPVSSSPPAPSQVLGWASANKQWAPAYPPGYEIGYDQITSGVSIVSTTEATGTTVIAAAAHTFDGSPVLCHFFSVFALTGTTAGSDVIASLFEGSTQIARIASLQTSGVSQAGVPMNGFIRFTPTAGNHTYTITAFTTNTTGGVSIGAGSSGTGTNSPAFVRFTKI